MYRFPKPIPLLPLAIWRVYAASTDMDITSGPGTHLDVPTDNVHGHDNTRDVPTVTMTMGPAIDYSLPLVRNVHPNRGISLRKQPPGASRPPSSTFAVVPGGEFEADGLDIIIGSDIQARLDDGLNEYCRPPHIPSSAECVYAIKAIFPDEDVNLQRRIVPPLAALGPFIIQAIITVTIYLGVSVLTRIGEAFHIPQSNIYQVQTPTSASKFAMITDEYATPTVLSIRPDGPPAES